MSMRPTIGRDEATKMSKSDKPSSQFAGSLHLALWIKFAQIQFRWEIMALLPLLFSLNFLQLKCLMLL